MSQPYQQRGSYIPKSDSGFRDFLENFANLVEQDPGRYALEPGDAQVLRGLSRDYSALYGQCRSTSTRTSGLIAMKDAVRASAEATVRVYAKQIKANLGVDNQSKRELGLRLDDRTPTPIPAPRSAPMLNIVGISVGEHTLQYADETTPNRRAKPPGVAQLELYVHVGPGPITDWREAAYADVYTKNPIVCAYEPSQANLTATYFARWRTARGLAGPMSLPVAMSIPFGGPVLPPEERGEHGPAGRALSRAA